MYHYCVTVIVIVTAIAIKSIRMIGHSKQSMTFRVYGVESTFTQQRMINAIRDTQNKADSHGA